MDFFGQNLKTLRKQMGLTQQELAQKLNLRKTTISNYETSFSSPPKNGLLEIARFFDVSIDELLSAPLGAKKSVSVYTLKSPSVLPPVQASTVRIFSSLSDKRDINSVRNLADTVSFSLPMAEGEYFGLVCRDNSLSSKGIYEGDYIIFKWQENVKSGELCAVSISNGDAAVGIYHETEREEGIIPLTIDEKHQPKFFPKNDGSFKVLGKAVRAVINFNG